MVVAKAFVGVSMSIDDSGTYIPPTLAQLAAGNVSPTQVDVIDSAGRLQRYFGVFNLADLQASIYNTSTFTGYQQFTGSLPDPGDLMYELSGASVNGQFIFNAIVSDNASVLLLELFKNPDQITGSEQNDGLIGFNGADTIKGAGGSDSLFGDLGSDLLSGNQGNDSIAGGRGFDFLRGGQDGDLLAGDEGDDRLNGNRGNDTLDGGIGADIFMLSKDLDVILDFDATEGDKIEILASTPYSLGSTGPDGTGDLQIIRDVGITTLIGVGLNDFDDSTSIVLI